MTIAFWFWLLMAIWLVLGLFVGYRWRPAPPNWPYYYTVGWNLILFLLLLMVGFQIFPDPFGTLVKKG